jgi:hypothetical protein
MKRKDKLISMVVLALIIFGAGILYATPNVKNYFATPAPGSSGDNIMHIGGGASVGAGASVTFVSGSSLKLQGVVDFTGSTVTGFGSCGVTFASGTMTSFVTAGSTVTGDTIVGTKQVTSANITATTTFTYKDATAGPSLNVKNDVIAATVTTGATTANVVGSTLSVAASALDAGEAITVKCNGVAAGTTSVKRVTLLAGGTSMGVINSQIASAGQFTVEFTIGEYTDSAHQYVDGLMVLPGGTVAYGSYGVHAATTINAAQVHTYTISIATPTSHLNNEVTLYSCMWTLRQ